MAEHLSPPLSAEAVAAPNVEQTVDQQPHKRRKITRACDLCKSKKKRCTGTQPCDTCLKGALRCTYFATYTRGRASPPRPSDALPVDASGTAPGIRRHPSSSTAAELGASPAASRHSQFGSPVATYPQPPDQERSLGSHHRLSTLQWPYVTSQEGHGSGVSSLHHDPYLPLPKSAGAEHERLWQPSQSKDPSRRTSPEPTNVPGHYLGPTSAIAWLHRTWRRLGRAHHVNELPEHMQEDAVAGSPTLSYGDKTLPVFKHHDFSLPSKEHTEDLVAKYFDFCMPTYRFLHRPTVSAWLAQLRSDTSMTHNGSKIMSVSRQAVIFMVLAVATMYQSDSVGRLRSVAPSSSRESDALFACAEAKLLEESGPPILESVQARFAQCLYLLSSSRPNKAWFIFGTVVQLSHALGLHRKRTASDGNSLILKESRRRLFWCIYTLDRYLSVMFGRPKLLQDEDIDVPLPTAVNDEDLTADSMIVPGRDDCFEEAAIFHSRLAKIVGQVSRAHYSSSRRSDGERLALSGEYNKQLDDWKTALPPFLSGAIRPSSLIPIFRRQSTVLRLGHAHALMLINRPFLLDPRTRQAGSEEQRLSHANAQDCVGAARIVVNMVLEFVSDKEMFAAFWFTQYIAFTALSVIYLNLLQTIHSGSTDLAVEKEELEAAEVCQQHLGEATRANAPSLRYSVILEELRQETRRQLFKRTGGPHAEQHQSNAVGANGAPTDATEGAIIGASPEDMFPMGDANFALSDSIDGDWGLEFWPQLDSLPLSYGTLTASSDYGLWPS